MPSSLNPQDLQPAINDVTFGALAKAQESLNIGKRERESGRESTPGLNALRSKLRGSLKDTPSKLSGIVQSKRGSKHAPVVQSSRRPVTRTLTVFEHSGVQKPRDPRFDVAVMRDSGGFTHSTTNKANENYSFLSQYQDLEIRRLRTQIKKTKDSDLAANIERQLMSMESKKRASETKVLEQSIRQNHRRKEKELIREGRKQTPYYLKDSDIKRKIEAERLKGMGRKQREKSDKRKRKKMAGKAIKTMPSGRRNHIEMIA